MEIRRTLHSKLQLWKNHPNRKPLLVQGPRQVGKTWLLKKFGETEFENYAYFNFEEHPELKQFFSLTKDVKRIIQNLALASGKTIAAQKTLLIFDEIQECNEALNALKYFQENAPEYAVVCAGSLLGVALSRGASFPVGKVDFMELYPLTFFEFLSVAAPELLNYLKNIQTIEPIPDLFYNHLLEKLKMFFISGGMPEAVVAILDKQDVELTQQVLDNILKAYVLDFSKHIHNKDIPKIGFIWSSIPSQLARENKKFLYQSVKKGARAREYENALLWLLQAGLVYKVFRNKKPALPLSAYDDVAAFKIYLKDIGLLRRLALLDPVAIREGNRLFTEFKGALSENFVLQGLTPQFEGMPRYWTSQSKAEVDFLIQYKNEIFPIEVKSDENVRSKSLTMFGQKYNPRLRIRYSLKNLKQDKDFVNIPMFLVDDTKKIMEMALKTD